PADRRRRHVPGVHRSVQQDRHVPDERDRPAAGLQRNDGGPRRRRPALADLVLQRRRHPRQQPRQHPRGPHPDQDPDRADRPGWLPRRPARRRRGPRAVPQHLSVRRALAALLVGLALAACGSPPTAKEEPDGVAEALRAFDRGDWVAAARLLREAVAKQPTDLRLHYSLAVTVTHLELREEAIREFQWVLANAPAGSPEAIAARNWLLAAGVLTNPSVAGNFSDSGDDVDGGTATDLQALDAADEDLRRSVVDPLQVGPAHLVRDGLAELIGERQGRAAGAGRRGAAGAVGVDTGQHPGDRPGDWLRCPEVVDHHVERDPGVLLHFHPGGAGEVGQLPLALQREERAHHE